MQWEKIVEIQYDAIQRSSIVYIAILSVIAAFSKQLSLSQNTKILLGLSFFFVLLQSLGVLFLINTQRKGSWKSENGQDPRKENLREVFIRNTILFLSVLATLSIFISVISIIFLKS